MRLAWLVSAFAFAACTRSPPASRADHPDDASQTIIAPSTVEDAASQPQEPRVDTHETQVTLKSHSSPTATVGELNLTLVDLIQVAEPRGGKVGRFHRAKLHVVVGSDARDIFLTDQTIVLGYTLRLESAGDGQEDPHAPREGIAVISVRKSEPTASP